jgi:hypothetical protein
LYELFAVTQQERQNPRTMMGFASRVVGVIRSHRAKEYGGAGLWALPVWSSLLFVTNQLHNSVCEACCIGQSHDTKVREF